MTRESGSVRAAAARTCHSPASSPSSSISASSAYSHAARAAEPWTHGEVLVQVAGEEERQPGEILGAEAVLELGGLGRGSVCVHRSISG